MSDHTDPQPEPAVKDPSKQWDDHTYQPFQLAADLLHLRTWGHPLNEAESKRLDEQLRQLALNVKHGTRDSSYL